METRCTAYKSRQIKFFLGILSHLFLHLCQEQKKMLVIIPLPTIL